MIINPYAFGFNPLSLSPALWLDGSDPNTLYDATTGGNLVAADGAIARWEDKSGNTRHYTQSNASYRPIRKTANQNGRDLVQFSNTHHLLCTAFGGGSARSLWIVYEDDSTAAYATPVGTAYVSYDAGYHGHADRTKLFSATYCAANTRNGNNAINGASIGDGQSTSRPANISILRCVSAGTLDRHITTLGADGSTPESRSITGRIAEVLVFASTLSAGNISAVENYLSTKWGIALS